MSNALLAALLVFAGMAGAQDVATSSSRLKWQQNNEDAQTLDYDTSIDGGVTRVPMPAPDCALIDPANTGEYLCIGDLPDLEPGTYTIELRASRTVDTSTLTSDPSEPLVFVRNDAPAPPVSVTVVIITIP